MARPSATPPPPPSIMPDAGRVATSDLRRAETTRPAAAAVLGAGGAVLIGMQGGFLLFTPGIFAAPELGFSISNVGLGALGLAGAAILLGLFVAAYETPRSHVELGVAAITVAILSLLVGGGLLLGALLAYVGGLLVLFHRPKQVFLGPVRVGRAAIESDPVVEADLIDSGLAAPEGPVQLGPRD